MTINGVLETYNNAICVETHNQLHLHTIIPQRNRILLEQRERTVQAFENVNEDYLTMPLLSNNFEISFSIVDCFYYTHVCQFTLMIDHFE